MNEPTDKPRPLQLRRTVQVVPGVHNRIVWTNAVDGEFLGEVTLMVFRTELAMTLSQDLTAWLGEQLKAVTPVPAGVLEQLNGRGQRRM
jgi:hypothetical protein